MLIKPNIGWDVIPDLAANTNPLLVKRIVEHCFKAGAKEVYVFDHTWITGLTAIRTQGLKRWQNLQVPKWFPEIQRVITRRLKFREALNFRSARVHELLLETDVFINVPVLKDHNSVRMTCCLKNTMGIVWDRGYWHSNNLNQCIADYALYDKKPALNIVDCYNVMVKHGPQGVSKEDVVAMKSQIITSDWVAADAQEQKCSVSR